jgi:hypothetical protein
MGIKGDLKVTVLGFSTNYKVNLTEYINWNLNYNLFKITWKISYYL